MLKNPFKTYRITGVYFFSSAIIIVLLIGIVSAVSYSGTSRQVASNTSYYQQRLLNELSKKMSTSLISIEQTSVTAAKNLDLLYNRLQDSDAYERLRVENELRTQLNYVVFGTSILQSIHVYAGYPFTSDTQSPVTFNTMDKLGQEPWYASIVDTDSAWIGEHTIVSNGREQPVISFARKVINNRNQYYSLMVFNIKVSSIKQLFSSEDDMTNMALLDAAGRLIAHSGDEAKLQAATRTLNGEMAQPSGSLRAGDDFFVWAKSPDAQWTLFEVSSWSEMIKGSKSMAKLFLLLGVSTIVLVLLITLFLSRRFMKPMNQMVRAMGEFSPGEAQTLPTDYTNEFGKLFHGYRKLTHRIEDLYDSLDEKHKQQRAAELKSLQTMINPHFLYNTLDQINWTAIEAGQNKISAMLAQVASMFRLVLTNTDSLVAVSEEIAHIDCYLKFQQLRWEDRLTYTVEIDDDAKACLMPKVMMQPFIENAFVHGFHGVPAAELRVRISREDNQLHVRITDNGRGLADNWQHKPRKRGGYGLRNVRERLDALFGSQYRLTLANREQGGVQVDILFPISEK
ncbi:cache domain-containing sensor histidine kinase [Paenibacillus whitsoniae]|uniref:Sensor histidine kinase n=1 Tax=Paenibacillus whitsoniae TaxID=2496558 RepID=A0A430JD35_9BACL|nr:sensor histidine kinase [Paenibacillus whitsoniae]RTE08924.1 sensor histidine kinase [Paenibacillus whitsoniae]